jgi:hypothetical protein
LQETVLDEFAPLQGPGEAVETVWRSPVDGRVRCGADRQVEDRRQAEREEEQRGRSAKFYDLTKTGRAQLEEERAQWRRFSSAIDEVLQVNTG